MSDIKAIIFDFGGVLLDLDISKTEEAMNALVKRPISASYTDKYKKWTLALETGSMSTEQFVWHIQSLCDPVPDPRVIISAWNAMLCGWDRDRFDLLTSLKKQYKIYLLSNTNEIHLRYVMHELANRYGVSDFEDRFFDACYYSHRLGYWKPQKEIYLSVQRQIGLMPDQFIFIDDNIDNVKGAHNVGWQAYHHVTNANPRSILKELGLLP